MIGVQSNISLMLVLKSAHLVSTKDIFKYNLYQGHSGVIVYINEIEFNYSDRLGFTL